MTQQKSDGCVVPQGLRKQSPTTGNESQAGGKAPTVDKGAWQLQLNLGTAEVREAQAERVDGHEARRQSRASGRATPKPKGTRGITTQVTMEGIASLLREAFGNVAANKGAPGPDRQSIEDVVRNIDHVLQELGRTLLDGTYRVGDIRRVWIPKSNGGQRGLGIPNVVDRIVQEAVRMVLEPLYEPTFDSSSHGFRPERSCHTAIAQARSYAEEGYGVVVDLDLEKFFDRVHHQRLAARLRERIADERIHRLIWQMLKARVVMPDGVVVATEEGVPQGGPLSPLMSNIVLDELDKELRQRGHRFVRYADDCNIYVRSQSAGERVMASISSFIERRMRLKVNTAKSAVAQPEERHFLGFRLRREPLDGSVEVLLSKRSKERIDATIRQMTPRNWGGTLASCITGLNRVLIGWLGFFGICTQGDERTLRGLDAHIRRRLRAIMLKQRKRKRSITRSLIRRGIRPKTAWRTVYGRRRRLWWLSHTSAVDRALDNAFFAQSGLISLQQRWSERQRTIAAPVQLTLALG
jgi:RNA-directed DNA polymerase